MKRWLWTAACAGFLFTAKAQQTASYTPAPENVQARAAFRDHRYGLFIHWGASSVLGDGEWVMHNRNIKVADYRRLQSVFNPVHFDAAQWVGLAKKAGMKYITFITRHHDSFSNWDTKASDWKITSTPYGKDVLKQLSEECRRQNMPLFLYYSLVDWFRDDYPHTTGRTGRGTGRTGTGNYDQYFTFMKTQLTELLTQYGPIAGIWFDGHWDQTAPEGAADRSSRLDWRYEELYGLIHRLQPQCLIGNNHHLDPIPGEDFQMFERDLPGENHSGLSFQKPAEGMPVETCETLNGSWGYNITDRRYKSVKQVLHLLVNAAGRDANLLLNVGPLPDGRIQSEFTDTLTAAGAWLQRYGHTVYGTRGKVVVPQPWGVVTEKGSQLFVHLLNPPQGNYIFLPGLQKKVAKAVLLANGQRVAFRQQPEGLFLYLEGVPLQEWDTILQLETK
ncbi:MAG TPA: alpha-L-fucosidase [Chitinophagaceae bacterium]|nr:alpha-L-fucosidase [Chitinophagaceae bacterium]